MHHGAYKNHDSLDTGLQITRQQGLEVRSERNQRKADRKHPQDIADARLGIKRRYRVADQIKSKTQAPAGGDQEAQAGSLGLARQVLLLAQIAGYAKIAKNRRDIHEQHGNRENPHFRRRQQP